MTEGFLGPLFFVWLGATLQLRDLVDHPSMSVLGACLGIGAPSPTSSAVALRQPTAYALLAAAQLGVPVAAATSASSSTCSSRARVRPWCSGRWSRSR